MRIPSPVLPRNAAVITGLICQYCRCMSAFASNPPQARMTPRFAATETEPDPLLFAHSPTTDPSPLDITRSALVEKRTSIPRAVTLSSRTFIMFVPLRNDRAWG